MKEEALQIQAENEQRENMLMHKEASLEQSIRDCDDLKQELQQFEEELISRQNQISAREEELYEES